MHVDAALPELRQITWQLGQRRAAAHVDADRDASVTFLRKKLHQAFEQLGRQIVDAIIGAVLEHIERDALARTGKAADDNELHAFRRACSAASAQLLFLTLDEFLGTVDAAQLQDVVAHRRFRQDREVAAGRNR